MMGSALNVGPTFVYPSPLVPKRFSYVPNVVRALRDGTLSEFIVYFFIGSIPTSIYLMVLSNKRPFFDSFLLRRVFRLL